MKMPSKVGKKVVGLIMRVPKAKKMEGVVTSSGLGEFFLVINGGEKTCDQIMHFFMSHVFP